jgi:tetrahydrodipicolinate N-succinyltransferase
MMHGPIFGSFAALIVTGASSETQTSENLTDRVEFFRNVKLLGFKVLPKVATTSGAALALGPTYRYQLINGTNVIATAAFLGSASDAGVMIDGGIRAGTFAELGSNSEVALRLAITGDGTTETYTAGSIEAYVLYEHRFA